MNGDGSRGLPSRSRSKMRSKRALPQLKKTRDRRSMDWIAVLTVAGLVIAVIGLPAALGYYRPRTQIDANGKYDPASPFPSSVKITNTGNIQLDQVSVRVRPTHVESEGGGKIIGATVGPGGITKPDWKISHLAPGRHWDIPMGRNVAFFFGPVSSGDVSVVVSYWPWLLPQFSFFSWNDEARLITHREPDGQIIWITKPR
jgi:hypothetical protein